jgi:hypothetical protein
MQFRNNLFYMSFLPSFSFALTAWRAWRLTQNSFSCIVTAEGGARISTNRAAHSLESAPFKIFERAFSCLIWPHNFISFCPTFSLSPVQKRVTFRLGFPKNSLPHVHYLKSSDPASDYLSNFVSLAMHNSIEACKRLYLGKQTKSIILMSELHRHWQGL